MAPPDAPEETARLEHLSVHQLEALQAILKAADAEVNVTALPPVLGNGGAATNARGGPAQA
jgi:hypothetical protein